MSYLVQAEETSISQESQHVERSVLGAMVLDGIAACEGVSKLEAQDFSLDSHRRIFGAILDLHKRGVDLDVVVLADELSRRHELDSVGGRVYVFDLTDGIPRNCNTEQYVARIQERSLARTGVKAAQVAIQRFYDSGDNSQAVCDDLISALSGERKQTGNYARDIIAPALMSLKSADERVIPTGIAEIDRITNGGMRTKELWIIGANPSRGKSSLLRQFELGAIQTGNGVHTHTVEMPEQEWILLHAAALANVPSWKIRKPKFITAEENDRLMKAALQVEQWPMILDDESSPSIESLVAKSRIRVMRDGIRMVGVDYIQLVHGEGRELRHQVGNIALRLKQFAKKHDCCVVALSQLARKGDLNARPTMQDLKESGDLEAHADVIIMPYRPLDTTTGKFTGEDELIITKQRNGAIGSVNMTYNVDNLRFESRRQA